MKVEKKSIIKVEVSSSLLLEKLGIKVEGVINYVVINKSKKDSEVKITIEVTETK